MKKILLILLVLFMTGCTANYNLEIDEQTFKEDISITIPKNVVDYNTLKNQFDNQKIVYPGQSQYYEMEYTTDNDNYYINYNFNHKIEDFNNSKFLNLCYSSNKNSITEGHIIISTSDEFKCIIMDDGVSVDEVKVTIKTKLKVIENNADKVDGDIYTWIINKNNYQKKPILMDIKLPTTIQQEVQNQVENIPNKEMFAIIGGIIFVALSLVVIIKIKRKRNNQL